MLCNAITALNYNHVLSIHRTQSQCASVTRRSFPQFLRRKKKKKRFPACRCIECFLFKNILVKMLSKIKLSKINITFYVLLMLPLSCAFLNVVVLRTAILSIPWTRLTSENLCRALVRSVYERLILKRCQSKVRFYSLHRIQRSKHHIPKYSS